MSKVREAVILAGGTGTRMLPASLLTPKEAMPLVDTPILNHLIWEVVKAGVTRIHLVLSEWKKNLLQSSLDGNNYFDLGVRPDLPPEALKLGLEGVEIISHIQQEPGGVADAISVAISHIRGPFLVLLGDMVILENHVGPEFSGPEFASSASLRLVEMFEKTGIPSVGVCEVRREHVDKYGVVEFSGEMVSGIIEKPSPEEAPSNYVLSGRYLFPPDTDGILDLYPVSEHGELQSISLLMHLANNGGLLGVKFDGMKMYDSGNPISWLESQIDHALRRDDIGDQLALWIKERMR